MSAIVLGKFARHHWLLTVLLCAVGMRSAIAEWMWESPSAQQVRPGTRQISVSNARPVVLEFPDWLTTVRGPSPEILRIRALRPDCLEIQGRTPGKAMLSAVDRRQQQYTIEVMVDSGAGSQ